MWIENYNLLAAGGSSSPDSGTQSASLAYRHTAIARYGVYNTAGCPKECWLVDSAGWFSSPLQPDQNWPNKTIFFSKLNQNKMLQMDWLAYHLHVGLNPKIFPSVVAALQRWREARLRQRTSQTPTFPSQIKSKQSKRGILISDYPRSPRNLQQN